MFILLLKLSAMIRPEDLSTNPRMSRMCVVRQIADFVDYCFHMVEFFHDELTISEKRILIFLRQRLEAYLDGAPTSQKYAKPVKTYRDLLSKIKTLLKQ